MKYKDSKNYELFCFIENDISKSGGSWGALPIYHPSKLSLLQYDIILLAGHRIKIQVQQLVGDLGADPPLLHKNNGLDLVSQPNLLKG